VRLHNIETKGNDSSAGQKVVEIDFPGNSGIAFSVEFVHAGACGSLYQRYLVTDKLDDSVLRLIPDHREPKGNYKIRGGSELANVMLRHRRHYMLPVPLLSKNKKDKSIMSKIIWVEMVKLLQGRGMI